MSQVFVKESLFRPFHSTKKKGLGIGLFQSRAIVQAHGGGMHVESELGKGTTFLVSFPVKTQQ
jgi:signal transduction histidine kinase